MKRAFSFVELIMVVAILGIMAAIVIPSVQSYTTDAKSAAARSNLRVLRAAIGLYTAQHSGVPPGYPAGNISQTPTAATFLGQLTKATTTQGAIAEPGTAGFDLGPYLKRMPENPFNGMQTAEMLGNAQAFPSDATGTYGWIYKAATKTIKLDWPGTDKDSMRYYDY